MCLGREVSNECVALLRKSVVFLRRKCRVVSEKVWFSVVYVLWREFSFFDKESEGKNIYCTKTAECGMIGAMKNIQTDTIQKKSTILLLIFFFILLNAVLLLRAGINALYFTEDTSIEHSTVMATVKTLQPDTTLQNGDDPRLIPSFSFVFQGEEILTEAPELAFSTGTQQGQIFKEGEEYTLWLHKRSGDLLLPPFMGEKEIGRSQVVISGVFFLMAIAVWLLRNRMAKKVQH